MGSKADIWMPLYIGDYLADTVMLDAEQSGCYLHWLMCYWRTGPLEDDLDSLILIGKLKNLQSASSTAQALLKKFFKLEEDGKWHQKRIDAEMVQWRDKRLKRIEKASKGGKALKELRSAPSTPQAVLGECPSPSPSPIEKKKRITQEEIDSIYQLYPRKVGKAKAEEAIRKAVLSNGHDVAWFLNRVKAYAQERAGQDPQYTPHASTWFNQKRYLDGEDESKEIVDLIDPETGKVLGSIVQ